jgi:NhaP-type Na+/H+ or K+/H+ antiporter
MAETGLAIIALGIIAYGLVSARLEGSLITVPMAFVAFGWLIGGGGLGLADISPDHGFIHFLAELTLILVLFSDAARIDLKRLIADHNLPQRMLLIGLPATVLLGILAAVAVFPGMSLMEAALIAAILSPTDAALGQAVVSNPAVPIRIRQALNVESGLNDGIVLPLVLVFAIMASGAAGSGGGLAVFALKQVTLGPLAGIAIGYAGARLIDLTAEAKWMSEPFEGITILALALLAFTGAESVGGNGFIAAFAAGLTFGGRLRHRCKFLFEFMETEGQFLVLLVFLIFGAAMLPDAVHALDWPVLLYAFLSLTVVRMAPVALSLTGTGLSLSSKAFLGWFGPRGLASILFALLIVERYDIAHGEEILACIVITAALSVLLHGLTAAPWAKAYGAMVARQGECEENVSVSEMPVRHGFSFNRLLSKGRPK